MDGQTNLYEDLVKSLMDSGSSELVSNGQPEHAMVLFKLFFERAKTRVKIFCCNLDEKVFQHDCLLKAAEAALNRGVFIEVIIQEEKPNESQFATWLQSVSNQENCRAYLKSAFNNPTFADLPANFAVMDNLAFRFEPNRKKIAAYASMNNPQDVDVLSKSFDQIKSRLK